MNTKHPLFFIVLGLLITSICFNVLFLQSNQRLSYKIQKLEAGPYQGLLKTQEKSPLSNEEINELLKEILKKMMRERIT